MKLRSGRRARQRLKDRIAAGTWDRSKGLTKPGSQNPKKGTSSQGGKYSRARTRDRSRRSVQS